MKVIIKKNMGLNKLLSIKTENYNYNPRFTIKWQFISRDIFTLVDKDKRLVSVWDENQYVV